MSQRFKFGNFKNFKKKSRWDPTALENANVYRLFGNCYRVLNVLIVSKNTREDITITLLNPIISLIRRKRKRDGRMSKRINGMAVGPRAAAEGKTRKKTQKQNRQLSVNVPNDIASIINGITDVWSADDVRRPCLSAYMETHFLPSAQHVR